MTIYQGFAAGLNQLNDQVVSDLQISTSIGRAYKKGRRIYADNEGVHFCSIGENMDAHLTLQSRLKGETLDHPDKPKVYAGAAGLLNLSYITATRPAAAMFYDVNFMQKVFWDEVIKALAECETVDDFIEFLPSAPQTVKEIITPHFNEAASLFNLFHLFNDKAGPQLSGSYSAVSCYRNIFSNSKKWLEAGKTKLHADRAWMLSGYKHLHQLAKNNALGAVTLDVNDTAACAQLKDYLDNVSYSVLSDPEAQSVDRQGTAVDVLYVSNIFRFISNTSDWTGRRLRKSDVSPDNAKANLQMLLSPDAQVIDDRGLKDWQTAPALEAA